MRRGDEFLVAAPLARRAAATGTRSPAASRPARRSRRRRCASCARRRVSRRTLEPLGEFAYTPEAWESQPGCASTSRLPRRRRARLGAELDRRARRVPLAAAARRRPSSSSGPSPRSCCGAAVSGCRGGAGARPHAARVPRLASRSGTRRVLATASRAHSSPTRTTRGRRHASCAEETGLVADRSRWAAERRLCPRRRPRLPQTTCHPGRAGIAPPDASRRRPAGSGCRRATTSTTTASGSAGPRRLGTVASSGGVNAAALLRLLPSEQSSLHARLPSGIRLRNARCAREDPDRRGRDDHPARPARAARARRASRSAPRRRTARRRSSSPAPSSPTSRSST